VKSGVRFDAVYRIRSASGVYRWFKSRSVPIRDGAGAITKWYGANTDIDDAKRTDHPQPTATEAR
jgi:PAS domain-containing protein